MNRPDTAVILAAGRGSRLQPALPPDDPKCLVKVNGTPLLHRTLDNLNALGLTRVVVVVGYQAGKVRASVGTAWKKLRIEYVENRDWAATNNSVSLYLVKDKVPAGCMLLEGDIYCRVSELRKMGGMDLAAAGPYENYMDGTVLALGSGDRVERFYLKDDPDRPQNLHPLFKTVNIYSFSPEALATAVFPGLTWLIDAGNVNVFYEKALAEAVKDGRLQLKGVRFSNPAWGEIDDPADLARAQAFFKNEERS